MKCTILQPTYLPWIGYFEMIAATDLFVIYDNTQFIRNSWHKRNRVKTANGIRMLSVPVQHEKYTAPICAIKISYANGNVLQKHWKVIEDSYKKSPYFKLYAPVFRATFFTDFPHLKDLNIALIKVICEILGIKSNFICSSELEVSKNKISKSEDLVSLCKKVGADYIYDAKGAESFLDKAVFANHGIEIHFQEYVHPVYHQLWGEFQPYMSAIDLLFNEGPGSLEIIKSGRIDK